MSYRRSQGGVLRTRDYRIGEMTEIVAMENEARAHKAEEERVLAKERAYRKTLNARIVELIEKGWPTEEIQIAVQRDFPDESASHISLMIDHWAEKQKQIGHKVDRILEKMDNEELSIDAANEAIKALYKGNDLYRCLIRKHCKAKTKEQKEAEEER